MSHCINTSHPEYQELLLQSNLMPAILKAKIATWMDNNTADRFPSIVELLNIGEVNQTLRVVDALSKIQRGLFTQDKLQGWLNDLQKQGVSNDQLEIFKEVAKPGMSREEIAASIAANYSYTVEINTANTNKSKKYVNNVTREQVHNAINAITDKEDVLYNNSDEVGDGNTSPNEIAFGANRYGLTLDRFIDYGIENNSTLNEILNDIRQHFHSEDGEWFAFNREGAGLAPQDRDPYEYEYGYYYSNLTVPGGTNYTENEISTPLITPSIKGHAQFATDNGIGWFRSDEQAVLEENLLNNLPDAFQVAFPSGKFEYRKENNNWNLYTLEKNKFVLVNKNEPIEEVKEAYSKAYDAKNIVTNKTRRILEVQSDLFQKWRSNFTFNNVKYSIEEDNNKNKHYWKDNVEITANEYNKDWNKFLDTFDNVEDAFIKLLQKEDNWVTFFIKSIIQDTAKQTITEVQQEDVEAKVKQLEKEGLLEIDCKGFKAKEGLTTNSNPKFGDWEIIKDLKGKPSHKQGGVDLSIKGNTIEAEGNELVLKNSVGDLAIIPKKDRLKIKDLISNNDEKGLTNYISKLPKEPNKAGDGGVYSDKYVKNNFFNRIFRRNHILEKQLMDENKSLYNVGKLKDFKILEATGKSKEHLEKKNRNPEYFPKRDTWFPYLDDVSQPIQLPNKNKYRTLVNDDNLSDNQLRDAIKFDFISHSLHNDKRYNELSTQLSQKLLTKYDQKFIDSNGGVDAYVRGILSDSEDYKPYKNETSFIEPEFINEFKNYVKTGK